MAVLSGRAAAEPGRAGNGRADPVAGRGALPFTPGEKGEGGDEAAAIRLRLAETLLTLGRQDEAETQIQSVLDRRPDDPRRPLRPGPRRLPEQWEAAPPILLRCLGNPFTQQKARVQLAAVCGRLNDAADADAYRVQADHLPKTPTGWTPSSPSTCRTGR